MTYSKLFWKLSCTLDWIEEIFGKRSEQYTGIIKIHNKLISHHRLSRTEKEVVEMVWEE